jgi:hypothetical protein
VTDDILAIHQLFATYAHLIDNGQRDRLGEVFAKDAVVDLFGRRYAGWQR